MSGLLDLQELSPDPVERADVPFGEWLPDMPALNNPGANEALNVIPADGGYIPFPAHVPDSKRKLSATVRGAYAVINDSDIVQLYTGASNGVYTDIGNGFVKILTQAVSSKDAWKFIRVNEQMVIVHPEIFVMRTPVGSTTTPVVLGGSPPKATCGAQVNDFLMLGNLTDDPDDGDGAFPSRIRWGGQNNIDLPWVSDPVTQADFQDMPAAGGSVRAISGREYGTIFQERMISRATYRGPPDIFDIETIEDRRGCIARDSIVDVGAAQFGIAEDGFFMWNGTNTELLGDSKVTRYFFNKLQYNMRSRISGAADLVHGCVMWGFPTDSTGLLNEVIVYSYKENKWSHMIMTLEFLVDSYESSITLDSITGSLDAVSGSFDDDKYRTGGRMRLAAFDALHTYGTFSGSPMAAALETSEFSGPDGRRVFANNARPIVDLVAPSATMQFASRDQMSGEPLVYSAQVPQELDGQCPVVMDGRYMRFRVNIPAGLAWTHALGVEIARKAAGLF